MQEQEAEKHEQLRQMAEQLRQMEADNKLLAGKQELMMQLVELQEIHMCALANHEVATLDPMLTCRRCRFPV